LGQTWCAAHYSYHLSTRILSHEHSIFEPLKFLSCLSATNIQLNAELQPSHCTQWLVMEMPRPKTLTKYALQSHKNPRLADAHFAEVWTISHPVSNTTSFSHAAFLMVKFDTWRTLIIIRICYRWAGDHLEAIKLTSFPEREIILRMKAN